MFNVQIPPFKSVYHFTKLSNGGRTHFAFPTSVFPSFWTYQSVTAHDMCLPVSRQRNSLTVCKVSPNFPPVGILFPSPEFLLSFFFFGALVVISHCYWDMSIKLDAKRRTSKDGDHIPPVSILPKVCWAYIIGFFYKHIFKGVSWMNLTSVKSLRNPSLWSPAREALCL